MTASGTSPRATRRYFLVATAACAAASLHHDVASAETRSASTLAEVSGTGHWAYKNADATRVRLFLWRKRLKDSAAVDAIVSGQTLGRNAEVLTVALPFTVSVAVFCSCAQTVAAKSSDAQNVAHKVIENFSLENMPILLLLK